MQLEQPLLLLLVLLSDVVQIQLMLGLQLSSFLCEYVSEGGQGFSESRVLLLLMV